MGILQDILLSLETVLGFSPLLMLPVFVGVSLVARVFSVKENCKEWKDFILGLLCVFFGIGVAYFTGYETVKEMFRNGFILGSVCALTYQIFVSLFEGLVSIVEKKIDQYAGKDINIESNNLFSKDDDK